MGLINKMNGWSSFLQIGGKEKNKTKQMEKEKSCLKEKAVAAHE